jgi:thiol-disulfide isomerase/thioredoxin
MNKFIVTLSLLATLTLLQAEEKIPPKTFTLTTTTEQNITIIETKEGFDFPEYKGKAVFIALFGHRCPPCLKEIPEFIELTNKHKDDLAIIAIEVQNYPADAVKEFSKEHQMNYNVIAGINHRDFISYLADRAGLPNGIRLPFLVAINKDGEVEGTQEGRLRQDELEFIVQDLNE